MEAGGSTEQRALLAYLEGQTSGDEAAVLEQRLASSAGTRRSLKELEALLGEVARPDPCLEGLDLVDGVRKAILQKPRHQPVSWWRRAVLLVAATGLLTLALGLWLHLAKAPAQRARDPFQARSARTPVSREDRWTGIKIFHEGAAEGAAKKPQPLGWQLPATHGLLVAYTNQEPSPHGHLMVFAVDHKGEVYWLHPAYERPGTNPSSISISRGVDVELSQIIHHGLRQGPLAIYGLFSRRPQKVLAVEQMVRDLRRQGRWRAGAPPRLPVDAAAQHVLRTWVVP